MRLLKIEKPLSKIIYDYIQELYHYVILEGAELPSVRVWDAKQFKEVTGISTWGAYDFRENILQFIGPSGQESPEEAPYYSGHPERFTVAHEIEHWAQAQRVGSKKYAKQLQELKTYLEYEKSADEVSLANAHKLKWLWK